MITKRLPVPAPGFEENPGMLPDTIPPETEVLVQWAGGWLDDHVYQVKQLRWSRTGHAWDVGAIKAA